MITELKYGNPYSSIYNRLDFTNLGSSIRHSSDKINIPQKASRRTLKSKPKYESLVALFDLIQAKFVEMGHGFHGAPVQDFRYHMDEARWIQIEPHTMGKVVVSNTCSKVNKF